MKIWLIVLANVALWPILHIAIARLILSIPLARFTPRRPVALASRYREARFYRDLLQVHRWKSSLPDGAPWLGGFSKKRFTGRDPNYVAAFLAETRRAEFAHWCMFLCCPVFFLWNPPWACVVMVLYAVAANAPCIVAQRSNRIALARLLTRLERRPNKLQPTGLHAVSCEPWPPGVKMSSGSNSNS